MRALIAFIVMAALILTLIEINERVKAKKAKDEGLEDKDDCTKKEAGDDACSSCGLVSVCDKKERSTPAP